MKIKSEALHPKQKAPKTINISPGVQYTPFQLENNTLIESGFEISIDVAHAHMNMSVLSPHNRVCRLSRLRDMVDQLENDNRVHVVAAINGDFFNPKGVPSGLQINEGEIITAPRVTKVAMVLTYNQTVSLKHHVTMDATLRVGQDVLKIDGINRTQELIHDNHLFLYNHRFNDSTESTSKRVEVVVAPQEPQADRLKLKQSIIGHVKEIVRTNDTPTKPGHIVLSATGEKAKWLEKQLAQNKKVAINIKFDQDVNDAKEVMSGNTELAHSLLKKGKINEHILNASYPENIHRHPRTMLAVKHNKLHIVIIDGRQPGYSDGITFAEGAHYLKSLGMEDGINIDGGGSTTCFVKQLGDDKTTIVNQPSDGFEREVGNALFIFNTSPKENLQRIVPTRGTSIKITTQSDLVIDVKAHDVHMNALPINRSDVSWHVTNKIGTIDKQGHFQAGSNVRCGEIIAQKDDIVERISVDVTNDISELYLTPEKTIVEPHQAIDVAVTAYDSQGEKVYISPDQLNWDVQGQMGSIDKKGRFHASSAFANGAVTADYHGNVAECHLRVGREPDVIEDFEVIDDIHMTYDGVVEDSVTLKQSGRPHPVRFGRYSGKVTYDFTGKQGTPKVSLNFQADDHDSSSPVTTGQPYRLGLWVYGDSNNNTLHVEIEDSHGDIESLEFTPTPIDWTGWKYVHTDIPKHVSYPLSVRALSIVATNDKHKNSGAIYFDDLQAEYMSLDEDLEGPVMSQYEPSDQTNVAKYTAVPIRVKIEDTESGVHAASISMWINDRLVDCKYDRSTGFVTYTQPAELLESSNHVIVEAIDNAGNQSVPKAEWVFFAESH